MVTMDDDNISLSLSDEDMLLCCDDDEDVAWSDASDRHGMEKNGDDDSKNNGRSRRLLSLEQSKVLYKILEKVRTWTRSLSFALQIATKQLRNGATWRNSVGRQVHVALVVVGWLFGGSGNVSHPISARPKTYETWLTDSLLLCFVLLSPCLSNQPW